MTGLSAIEASFLRTLNQLIEPAVRAGYGSSCTSAPGLIVLETTGRRSGALHRVPLFATLIDDHLLVATLRGERSQWIRNARAAPDVRYWRGGRIHQATALAFSDAGSPDTRGLPPLVRDIAASLHRSAVRLGIAFAVLAPATGQRQ
jgi:deazaflavin-dependent oxidoreductase (nitroreductase family)